MWVIERFFWRLPVPAVAPVEALAPIASSRPAPALPKTAPKAPANERVVPATPPATDAAQPPPPAPFALTFKPDELQAVVAEMFEGMLPRLALTPAQKEALMGLLQDRQVAVAAAVNAALQRGLQAPRDIAAIAREAETVREAFDQRLRAEFGDAAFAEYRAWDNARTERNTLMDFNRIAGDVPLGLSPEQSALFLETLAATKGPYPPLSVGRIIYGGMNQRARISERTVEALHNTGAFSPGQMEHLLHVWELQQRPPSK